MLRLLSAMVFVSLVAGCEVYPVVPAAGVVVVHPVGVAPGPGYGWRFRETHGWGWYHPRFGWYGRYY